MHYYYSDDDVKDDSLLPDIIAAEKTAMWALLKAATQAEKIADSQKYIKEIERLDARLTDYLDGLALHAERKQLAKAAPPQEPKP